MEPKYPEVTVIPIGEDGNTFYILCKVNKTIHHAKIDEVKIDTYMTEEINKDYDHLMFYCRLQ